MSDLRNMIGEVLKDMQLASLATITEDGKPWVRYMMVAAGEDLTLRMATFRGARKVKQIEKNAEVHVTCGVTDPREMKPYLQIEGHARLDVSEKARHDFWNETLVNYFQGPDDPNYGVIEVVPYRIEYVAVGSHQPEVLDL